MTRREDRGSNTEHDAALFEAHRAQDTYDDGRPSLADCIPDECEHDQIHEDVRVVWVCDDCGEQVCDE